MHTRNRLSLKMAVAAPSNTQGQHKFLLRLSCWPRFETGVSRNPAEVDRSQRLPMSAMGQKRTFTHLRPMSALPPPKADIGTRSRNVRFVPYADMLRCGRDWRYSITSSARASRVGGTSRPSVLAVFRLTTSSKLVGCCTGRSAGLSPLRMRPA